MCFYDLPNKHFFQPLGGQSVDNLNHETTSWTVKSDVSKENFQPVLFLRPHWTRFTFRGKAFRLRYYKRLNRFFFNLGFSHPAKLILTKVFLGARKPRPKERTRQRYGIFCYCFAQLQLLNRETQSVKPYNPYTQRGLRLRSQPITRRFGKISQHISSLH